MMPETILNNVSKKNCLRLQKRPVLFKGKEISPDLSFSCS